MQPYRSNNPFPVFATPNDLIRFMKNEVTSGGLLRPCQHLVLRGGDQGYIPGCERASLKTEPVPMTYPEQYDFYGCDPDCHLFAKNTGSTPWNPQAPRKEMPGTVKAAWITGVLGLVGVLIMGIVTLSSRDKASPVSDSQVVQQGQQNTQQSQSVQNSPGSTTIGSARDVYIGAPPPQPAPAPQATPTLQPPSPPALGDRLGRGSLSESLTVRVLKAPTPDTPFVAVALNGTAEHTVSVGRRYGYLYFDPPKRSVSEDQLPLTMKLSGGEVVVKRFTEKGVVLQGSGGDFAFRIYTME